MPLHGHWEHTHAPLRQLTQRERWIIRVFGVLVAAACVALVAGVALVSSTPAAGCVQATYPSSTGAGSIKACGRAARELCSAAEGGSDRYSGVIQQACRRARVR
jgi:hypothetical protein